MLHFFWRAFRGGGAPGWVGSGGVVWLDMETGSGSGNGTVQVVKPPCDHTYLPYHTILCPYHTVPYHTIPYPYPYHTMLAIPTHAEERDRQVGR